MLDGSQLTAYHRLPLHFGHAVLIQLTVLFLLLGGVSGPGTGYWWLSVKYGPGSGGGPVNGRGIFAGQTWSLGGLGACVASER